MRRESGFSLAEVLIATAVMLMVTGAVFALVQRVAEAVDAQPEATDVQQRLRVGVLSLQRELMMAGAGTRFIAPVQPYRWGSDPSTFRTDVISVAYVAVSPAELSVHTFYLKADEATNTFQLMHFDGVQTDMPVVDNVIDLRFRYWGDPSPDVTELNGAELTDGPWRPDEGSALRYDADLLRVRRIEVLLRVQASAAWLRGPASTLFTHAGTGDRTRYVLDQEITFGVAPPNLNLDR